MDRVVQLKMALLAARPYVLAFAENAPADDGGDEAVAALEKIDEALDISSDSFELVEIEITDSEAQPLSEPEGRR